MPHTNFVIPYRNRPDSLKIFLEEFPKAIKERNYITSYNIIIVEQDDELPFNLGKLLNCGFDYVKKDLRNYNYSLYDVFFFHPIDLLPHPEADYRHDEIGITWLCWPREHDGYPKAILMQNCYYEKINGFTNLMFGWGGEDFEVAVRAEVTETNYLIRKIEFIDNESKDPKGLAIRKAPETYHEIICELWKARDVHYSGLNTLEYVRTGEEWISENTVKIKVNLKSHYRGH